MDDAGPRAFNLSVLTDSRMRRLSHQGHLLEAKFPGECTYVDAYACGKHGMPVGVDGNRSCQRYAIMFSDAKSTHRRVYFSKTNKDAPHMVKHYLGELGNRMHAGGHFVLLDGCRRNFHTDGGGEFNSEAFNAVLREYGCAANVTSCPHTPSSNGAFERSFVTLGPDARARLAMADMSLAKWHWAFRHAVVARNMLATQRCEDEVTGEVTWKTPFELFYGRRPNLNHQAIFGSPCRVLLQGEQRPKG
jgi:hypothetical protein